MSSLVLELKQGESMILNGAVIRFKTRTKLELNNHARFLFGKQVMRLEDATSPPRQAYYALQQVYIGPEEERAAALDEAREVIGGYLAAAGPKGKADWAALQRLATEETALEALKLARRIIRDEETSPRGN